ncbi:MAG TPA: hypothetical protein VFY59_07820 [Rubrobacter sp.]|nr:hypothetical protein [Rubrobacter sp.]
MTEGARERGRGAGGMGARAAAWLAWSVCAFSLVLTALGLAFLGLNRSHPGVPVFEFAFRATVITASCSSVGVIIASRRPAHPIGWLFGAVGLLSGVHLFSGEYAIYALAVGRGELWGGGVAAWITCWLWVPINALLAFVALLFPDGRPPSPRWRALGWINGIVAVAGSFTAAFLPGPSPWLPAMDNPLGVEGLRDARNLLDASLEALSYGVLVAGVVSLYFRYRRAGRVEHQQIKWLAYVGAVLLSGTILLNAGPDSLEGTWIKQLGFAMWVVGFAGVPIAIGIAIFRYRLYEIDVIINRTLVYGALTVVMATVFESIDATLHYLLVTLAHVHTLFGSIIAALVVGALFDPVRHRIQRFVDGRLRTGEEDGGPAQPEGEVPS